MNFFVGVGAEEGAQFEGTPEERPAVWHVGDDDGGATFSSVPKDPFTTIGVGEAVVFVEDGGENLGGVSFGP